MNAGHYEAITVQEAAADPAGVEVYRAGRWVPVERVTLHGSTSVVRFRSGATFTGPARWDMFRRSVGSVRPINEFDLFERAADMIKRVYAAAPPVGSEDEARYFARIAAHCAFVLAAQGDGWTVETAIALALPVTGGVER